MRMDKPIDNDSLSPRGSGDLDGHVDDWEELAVLYLDGALSYEAKRAVEAHLRACASCAARMETQRRVVGLLETVEYIDPPSDLFGRIQDGLLSPAGAPSASVRRRAQGRASWRRIRTWVPVTVAVAAVLIGVFAYGLTRERPGPFSSVVQGTSATTTTTRYSNAVKAGATAPTAHSTTTAAAMETSTTAAAATTTMAVTSSVTMTESSVPPTAIQDKALLIDALESTNGPAYLTVAGTAGAGPADNNSAPASTTSTGSAAQSGQSATAQLQLKALLITNMTTLEPLSTGLWLGGPTFAAFLRQSDASTLVDLLNSAGLTVSLEPTPPDNMTQIAAQILDRRPDLPVLGSGVSQQPGGNGNALTTSTLAPAGQSSGTQVTLPDESGAYVLIILVVAR
jgi:Putative zinc-finger